MLKDWAKFAGFAAILAVALTIGFLWALNYMPQNSEWTCKTEDNASQPNSGTKIFSCRLTQVKKLNDKPKAANSNPAEDASDSVKITDVLLAAFTALLVLVGGLQACYLLGTLKATKASADAALLNAQALIDVERAHLYAVIKKSNLREALRNASWYEETSSWVESGAIRPQIEVALKNLGRTPAIVHDMSMQIAQRLA